MNTNTRRAQPQRLANHSASLPSEPWLAEKKAKMRKAVWETSDVFDGVGKDLVIQEERGFFIRAS